MPEPDDKYRALDEDARKALAALVGTHRQAALATLDGGVPYQAMTAYVAEPGPAGFLVHLSDLSAHKQHLRRDPRCSLLIFEPDDGRTEILQHRRLSLRCRAEIVARDTDDYERAKTVYLEALPKHALMFTLGDFDLVRLVPSEGLLVAGFGQAYRVMPDDLATAVGTGVEGGA